MDMMKTLRKTYKVARVARTTTTTSSTSCTTTTTTLIGVHEGQQGRAELSVSIKLAHLPPDECERRPD